jgi:excisionase family DNA binding protein
VLRSEQAAELLQLTAAAVERLAEQGELPGRKLAGEWRFSRAALLAWLAQPAPPSAGGADERGR